jgi:uncharacterized phage protein (TIGR02220 family)
MARIRTTKPEFWSSEQIMDVSPLARLAFIGLWNFCDDGGVHPASAKTLKAEIFPSDDMTSDVVLGLINELIKQRLIEEFTADGKKYWSVTGWKKHQRIEKPSYRYPSPPPSGSNGGADGTPSPSQQTAIDEGSSTIPGMLIEPSPPEWKGVEGNLNALSGTPDAVPTKPPKQTYIAEANEVLAYLNQVVGAKFQPVPANLNLIASRLREGATVANAKAVIDRQHREWANHANMRKYLRPETLFGATKFAGYVGQVDAMLPEPDKPLMTRDEAEAYAREQRAIARRAYLEQQEGA